MSNNAVILDGPSLRDDGCVVFTVRVGAHEVILEASPLGIGAPADLPTDVSSEAMMAVADLIRDRREEMWRHYRQAGNLRRRAGNPPLIDRTQTAGARLVLPPTRKDDAVVFRVQTNDLELRVFLFQIGGIIDDYDEGDRPTDAERIAAMALALNYVLAHPVEAAQWGIDAALYRDLWG